MSERATYPAGVPCWVETFQPDVPAAKSFYAALFGWEFVGPGLMPGDPPGEYHVARIRGRDVAGLGSRPAASMPPAWLTAVSVESADDAAQKVVDAGGTVVAPPTDADPAGRFTVIRDPSGAIVELWEPTQRAGAQLVNEPGAWAMSMLRASDPQRAAAFYKAAFGWETDEFAPGVWLFRQPGYVGGEPQQPVPRDVIAALAAAPKDTPGAGWAVDFWVRDADAAADQASHSGGTVIAAPSDAGPMRQGVLADPAGATFTVTTAPHPM